MTYAEIGTMIAGIADAIGCPYRYYQYDESEIIKTPYLVWEIQARNDFKADDQNYQKIAVLAIEYDSDFRDIDTETVIETALSNAGLTYTMDTDYINSQKVYETMYTCEVVL